MVHHVLPLHFRLSFLLEVTDELLLLSVVAPDVGGEGAVLLERHGDGVGLDPGSVGAGVGPSAGSGSPQRCLGNVLLSFIL